jgi:hypothetical protein
VGSTGVHGTSLAGVEGSSHSSSTAVQLNAYKGQQRPTGRGAVWQAVATTHSSMGCSGLPVYFNHAPAFSWSLSCTPLSRCHVKCRVVWCEQLPDDAPWSHCVSTAMCMCAYRSPPPSQHSRQAQQQRPRRHRMKRCLAVRQELQQRRQ